MEFLPVINRCVWDRGAIYAQRNSQIVEDVRKSLFIKKSNF